MSYIYKTQTFAKQQSNDLLANSNLKDSVETIDSFTSSTNSSILNAKSSNNQALFSSPSSSSSYSANLNTDLSSTNNLAAKNGLESQEDLRLIDSTMSPISSTNSVASPRLISGSSNNINSNANNHSSGTVQSIPTRFVDRRVSTSIIESNPYKFNVNYSEAGQRLAKKAQEQLKTVEKSKELNKLAEEQNKTVKVTKKE